MNNLIFLGTDFKKGKGGVASVLEEYAKLFPVAKFISTTNSGSYLSNFLAFIKAYFRLLFILVTTKNNIVHIHGASYNSFYRKYTFYKLTRLFDSKIIYHIHGAEFHVFYEKSGKKTRKCIKSVVENVDCLICLSEKWELFFKHNFKVKRIDIVPNIIPEAKLIRKKSQSNIISFLVLGYIAERKGIWLLLDVLKKNKDKLNGKTIFYIGGNGETGKLEKLIVKYKLEHIVKFIGWVSKDKKIGYLNKSDVFILPSYNEGLPISILEAMSYELPIISTNVGGIPEIVDSNNGILIEPGNKEQLIGAIFCAINNPHEFKNKGKESAKRIAKHLPDNVKKELIKIYNHL